MIGFYKIDQEALECSIHHAPRHPAQLDITKLS